MNDRSLETLKQENAHLRNELAAKSDFLSMVVHQLRTPLSATKWLLAMIAGGDFGTFDPTQQSLVNRGEQSIERMIRMLAEITQANHLSEWKLSMTIVPSDIAPCIAGSIEEFSAAAKLKKVRLTFHQNSNIPRVMCDHERICIVIENLVENAIKYNQVGGSVTVKTEPVRGMLIVSVADTGIGIPMDEQSKLFQKFYRASNVRGEPGTGLGLYICKQIIEANRGTIWTESTPGVGTTFFFSLPLAN